MSSFHASPAAEFFSLVNGRRGHFLLESGHHSALWFDLDGLFSRPKRVAPLVASLAALIRPLDVHAVCGPLRGGAFLAQLVAHALGAEFLYTQRWLPPESRGLFDARYVLPPAFAPGVSARRIAMVDDAMSAGSALRGTFAELQRHGGVPVAAGALMVLGTTGADFFARELIPVLAVARDDYELFVPAQCPQCAAGMPLENVGRANTRSGV